MRCPKCLNLFDKREGNNSVYCPICLDIIQYEMFVEAIGKKKDKKK